LSRKASSITGKRRRGKNAYKSARGEGIAERTHPFF
jgi:hypothetical protein